MEKVIVSVIIPCYKQAHFLRDAINSVKCQTFKAWEIIVVNDGSPDNTTETANLLGVRCIEKKNGGLSSARNAGIKAAKGEFILPLDADDKIHPEFLEKTMTMMDEVDVVGTWFKTFGNSNREHQRYVTNVDSNYLRSQNPVTCCSLFRKSMWKDIGGYDEKMNDGYEDWDFWLSAAEHGYKIQILPEYLFYYRKHSVSMLRDAQSKHDQILEHMKTKRSVTKSLIDVVIPVGTGSVNSNNELRFCLRSIEKNLRGYRNIWIVGFMPKWLKNLKHITFKEYHPKANNIHDKIKAACEHPEVSDEFIMFNDDYFLTSEVQAVIYPNYYSRQALADVMGRKRSDPYRRLVVDTINETRMIDYYDIHVPLRIKKSEFLSMPYNRNYEGGILVKSSYAKHAQVQGIDRLDPIIRNKATRDEIENMEIFTDVISIHDEAINQEFIDWVQERYPHKCSYEA
jgi:glycosyltransferase involved in cell wall biosynthesis